MPLTRMIYSSRPIAFSEVVLRDILGTAQRRNIEDSISGCLLCREDIYLQLLEGPRAAVDRVYDSIRADPRHKAVMQLLYETAGERMFAGWSMRTDMLRSHMWSAEQVAESDVEASSRGELLKAFEQMVPPRPPDELLASPAPDVPT